MIAPLQAKLRTWISRMSGGGEFLALLLASTSLASLAFPSAASSAERKVVEILISRLRPMSIFFLLGFFFRTLRDGRGVWQPVEQRLEALFETVFADFDAAFGEYLRDSGKGAGG